MFENLADVQGKTILFGIMDWGLGHASRCVPVIKKLIQKNKVIIASSGNALSFLKNYFPSLTIIEKPGYHIRYSKTLPVSFSILSNVPSIISSIRKENNWLKKQVEILKPDEIISDNCYGFYHQEIKSIIITHQLMLKMPAGFAFAESTIHHWIKNRLIKFDECWVPDYAGENNLSGDLSHKYPVSDCVKFIGPLSRFDSPLQMKEKDLDVTYLISGPAPHRTIFQEQCIADAKKNNWKAVLVSGLPGNHEIIQDNLITIFQHLDDEMLLDVMCRSKKVICRSGYSSIMDFHVLQIKATMYPTPGQTEQEYLANYHVGK